MGVNPEGMYHILRVILYRLWVVSTLTLFSSVLVFWFYGFLTAFAAFILGISGKIENFNIHTLQLIDEPNEKTHLAYNNENNTNRMVFKKLYLFYIFIVVLRRFFRKLFKIFDFVVPVLHF